MIYQYYKVQILHLYNWRKKKSGKIGIITMNYLGTQTNVHSVCTPSRSAEHLHLLYQVEVNVELLTHSGAALENMKQKLNKQYSSGLSASRLGVQWKNIQESGD